MALTITDTFVDISGVPQAGYVVTATPNYTPFFENFGGVWKEVKSSYISATTDSTGLWSLTLPYPSVSDPASTKWIVTLPDGTRWLGLVPEGIAGPLTMKTLKDSYAWGVVSGSAGPVTAVVGPPGSTGPPGLGLTWRNAWSSATAYSVNDAVSYTDGSSYVCILANTNHVPTNATYWTLLAQVGATGPSGAGGGYLSNEADAATFASFAAAITAIGSTPTALIVHTSMAVAANVTIPSTCSLVFRGTGQLAVATGVTVTINGPLTAPHTAQIFSLTGTGAVNLAQNSTNELWVEWFGAKADTNGASGNGTDSTAMIQAAINAVPAFGGIDVRFAGGKYRFTSTISVVNSTSAGHKSNMRILGQGGRYTGPISVATELWYDGAATTSHGIDFHTRESHLQGIRLLACSGRTLGTGIDVDIDAGLEYICTANRFVDVSVDASQGAITDGMWFGRTATGNVEFMEFQDCRFNACTHSGTAWVGGMQAFGTRFWSCSFTGGAYGVYATTSAAFHFFECDFSGITTCAVFHSNNAGQDTTFTNSDSESCPQLCNITAGTVSFFGGRYNPTPSSVGSPGAGTEYIRLNGTNAVMFGMTWTNPTASARIGLDGSAFLVAAGCQWAMGTQTPLVYSAAAATSVYTMGCDNPEGDLSIATSFGNIPLTMGRPLNLSPLLVDLWGSVVSGVSSLLYDAISHRALVAENGGPWQGLVSTPVLPPAPFKVSASTGGTRATGNQYYKVTFVTAAGETLASRFCQCAPALSTGKQTALLSAIPLGPPGVTARKIYLNVSGVYDFLATIADNTTTTYTDDGSVTPSGVAEPGSDTSGLVTTVLGGATVLAKTATTIGVAGSASAMPTPVGYIDVLVNGSLMKVAYFNS